MQELATAKFDETVEVHFRLGIDPRKADQNIRGSIALPHGTGKQVRVAVFAEGDKAREAEAAGAEIVGSDDLVAAIQAGEINFDAAIATPNMMAKVGRIGKILGPARPHAQPQARHRHHGRRQDGGRAQGRPRRVPCRPLRHLPHPHGPRVLRGRRPGGQLPALITEILRVKPSTAKGKYVKSVTVTSTMGPGIKVDPLITRNLMEATEAPSNPGRAFGRP